MLTNAQQPAVTESKTKMRQVLIAAEQPVMHARAVKTRADTAPHIFIIIPNFVKIYQHTLGSSAKMEDMDVEKHVAFARDRKLYKEVLTSSKFKSYITYSFSLLRTFLYIIMEDVT